MLPNSSVRLQTALGVHGQLEVGAFRRTLADHAGRDLHVLLADRVHDVAGGQVARSDLLRVEPDAHRVVARTEQLDVAHAGDARQLVLDVQGGVVAQVQVVIAAVRRIQVDHHRDVGRALDRGDADLAHLFRQARQRALDAVLHGRFGLLDVGADLEGHGQLQRAVRGVLRGHVEHVLDAVDLLFDRGGDGFRDHLRIRARVLGAHHHGRRHHFRILGNRQLEDRDEAGHEDDDRQHRREDRLVDEKA
jgi:hypothetical protein